MKGNIKLIIGFLIGIVVSGITIYAATAFKASDVSYKEGTVEDALNDLYSIAGGRVTTGEAFLITASKGLKLWHNYTPYGANYTVDDLDFSNIKSINYSYSLTTSSSEYQSVKLFTANDTFFNIGTTVSNQTVVINGPTDPVKFDYIVSNYNTGIFTINSYTRMNDTVVNFNQD